MILPRVTELELTDDGHIYVKAPQKGWRSTLKSCHDFISAPIEWGNFLKYPQTINDFLYYRGSYGLNIRYKPRFKSWQEKEVSELLDLLSDVIDDDDGPMTLDTSDTLLFSSRP